MGKSRKSCKACAIRNVQLLRDTYFLAGFKLGLSIAQKRKIIEEDSEVTKTKTTTVVEFPDAKLDTLVKEQWLQATVEDSHEPNLVSLP